MWRGSLVQVPDGVELDPARTGCPARAQRLRAYRRPVLNGLPTRPSSGPFSGSSRRPLNREDLGFVN
jgi:hypothetical protein